MGQVLHLVTAAPTRPLIVFGYALVMRLSERAAELTGIPLADILGDRHIRPLAYTRFAIALVANEHGKSLSQIGRIFHGRHHTTIRDGVHRARLLEATDRDFAELVRLLREEAGR